MVLFLIQFYSELENGYKDNYMIIYLVSDATRLILLQSWQELRLFVLVVEPQVIPT